MGYNVDEVRGYLHLIADEIERLSRDVDRSRAKTPCCAMNWTSITPASASSRHADLSAQKDI